MTRRRMLLAAGSADHRDVDSGYLTLRLRTTKCGVDTLRGLYLFSATGFIIPAAPAPAQPKAIVEFFRLNGDGTIDGRAATRSLNGVIGQFPDQSGPGGSYTVASSRYELIEAAWAPSRSPAGRTLICSSRSTARRLWMIQTDAGNVLPGDGRPSWRTNPELRQLTRRGPSIRVAPPTGGQSYEVSSHAAPAEPYT